MPGKKPAIERKDYRTPHWPLYGVHSLLDKAEKARLCDLYADSLANQPGSLAQYLRESKSIKPFAIEFIIALLDPESESVWQLKFSRRRRGKPPREEVDDKLITIGRQIEAVLNSARKSEAAVAYAMQEFGVSRATAHRALRRYRTRKTERPGRPIEMREGLIAEKVWQLVDVG